MRTFRMLKKFVAMGVVMVMAVGFLGAAEYSKKMVEMTDMLFDAISKNDIAQAEFAIKDGANLKATRFDNGVTPLIYAIERNRNKIVELLIQSKADINAKDIGNKGRTPLLWAIYYRYEEKDNVSIITALINAGVDVNIQDNDGKTALIYAAEQTDESLVDFLIGPKTNVNIRTKDGMTALGIVVRNKNNDPPRFINQDIYITSGKPYDEVIKLLKDAGAVE